MSDRILPKICGILLVLLAVLSCQRQELDPETVSDTVTIHFTMGPIGTRTVLGEPTDGSYPSLWQEGDQLTFNLLSANTDADAVSVTPTVSQDGRSASFSVAVPEATAHDVFYAMCPASANLARDNANKTWVLEVPTTQTPSASSPDPLSQLIWARSEFTTLPESVSLQFQHITAYGCLSLENLALGDATIQSVSLVASGGLFGRYFFYIDDIGDYLMGDLRANRTSNSVTLITSAATGIWFSCFPLDVSGSTLKVTVTTDKGTFTKTVSVPEGKSFKAGKVTKIKVDMSDIPLFNPVLYQRVNDMSEIGPDDDVIIAALNGQNYYAINTTQNKNARGSAEVTVENDRIVDPGAAVEIFKVESGASAGTWRFRATKKAGYLYAASPTVASSNSLKTSADGSDVSDNFDRRSSWYVSIADGIATVQSDLVSVAPNVATLMQLNSGNNNFACYVPNAFQNFPYPSLYKKVNQQDAEDPSEETPELLDGDVLWLDLTGWQDVNPSDAALTKKLWDVLHVSATLQGVVNRNASVLYLDYVKADGFNTDEYWWNKYSTAGEWLDGRKQVKITDPVLACKMLRDHFQGLVVYDPKIPATSCIASMVAGVEDLVAVRYDPSSGSCYSRLVEMDIPVKVWLVEEDGTSRFQSKTAAYRWAIDQYLKSGRCNTGYAGYYIDQYWLKNPGAAAINHHLLSNHDFFVSKRAFFFDLSPWPDEVATDDPNGAVGGDYETLKEILLECYRQNDNGDTFCHIGGFPAWAFKYTNYGNVGGNHTPVQTEWKFAEIIGEYNAFKDADAISYGALANASFWQHFPLRASYPQAKASREVLKSKGYLDADGHVDRSKRYILLYVGDYDAASWIYQTTPSLWDNSQRGKVPMMWSVSPILARRAPQVMHYLWTTATENDYFAAADNGAGYLNPGSLETPRAISGLPSGMEQWASHCKPWYEQWGITITGFIIDGNVKGMTQAGFEAYSTFSPDGIVPQKTPEYISSVNGMPILRAGGSANYDQPSDAAAAIRNTVTQHTDRPFYWFRAILKSPSWYVNVKTLLDQSNPEIVWMSGPEYFELLKCYLEEQ